MKQQTKQMKPARHAKRVGGSSVTNAPDLRTVTPGRGTSQIRDHEEDERARGPVEARSSADSTPAELWIGCTDRGRRVVGDTYGDALAQLAALRDLDLADLAVSARITGGGEVYVYATRAERDADLRGEATAGWFARVRQVPRWLGEPTRGALSLLEDASAMLGHACDAWRDDGAPPTHGALSMIRGKLDRALRCLIATGDQS